MNNFLSLSTPSTKIILVRHARTTYNEQGRYQGSSDDSVLTEKGHQDALST
jgi:probable phosphoglycerate mutase